jgi:hypothetical protein
MPEDGNEKLSQGPSQDDDGFTLAKPNLEEHVRKRTKRADQIFK